MKFTVQALSISTKNKQRAGKNEVEDKAMQSELNAHGSV